MSQEPANNPEYLEALRLVECRRYTGAIPILRSLADAGHAGAQAALGELFLWGFGVDRSVETAYEYFQSAAKQGHGYGAYYIATCLRGQSQNASSSGSVRPHWISPDAALIIAVRELPEMAAQGDRYAMGHLAFLYQWGQGVTLDPAEALYWFKKAFDAGHHAAANGIFQIYYECILPEFRDKALARAWYRRADQLGVRALAITEFDLEGR